MYFSWRREGNFRVNARDVHGKAWDRDTARLGAEDIKNITED